ncbi:MAG: hypothetical protein JXR60_07310 [Bacteroidales bacterium]|nr:hypothetical protein [Bacteroidales bacterium]
MNLKISGLLVFVTLLLSCKQNDTIKQHIIIEATDSLTIEFPTKKWYRILYTELNVKENKLLLLLGSNSFCSPMLYQYNLSSASWDSISFKSITPEGSQIDFFHYLSKDSIYLFCDIHSENNDSLIILTNDKAENRKTIALKHPYIRNTYAPYCDTSLLVKPVAWFNFNSINKHNIFLSFTDYNFTRFKADSLKHIQHPLIAYYDLAKDSLIMNNNIWYPDLSDGFYPWGAYFTNISLGAKGNPLVSFSYTPTFLEWDIKENKLIKHEINSEATDSILPYKEYIDEQYSTTQPYYGLLVFDNYNKTYTRHIVYPNETYGDFKNIQIHTDENFNVIGESYNQPLYIPLANGWNLDFFNSQNENKIILKKIKYAYRPYDESLFVEKMRAAQNQKIEKLENYKCSIGINRKADNTFEPSELLLYFKNRLHIEDSTYVVYAVQNNACPGCVNYVYKFFKLNKEIIESKPFYLLIVEDDKSIVTSILNEYEIKSFKNLKQDSIFNYQVFHPYLENNPRLILIKNNQIITDSIYAPDNLPEMIYNSLDFINFKH